VSILSLPATARLLERRIRETGPATHDQLIAWLTSLDVARDRAEAGLRLAITCGRLELATDDDGHAVYQTPHATERAA
jgi:hypothetical protein